jgi:pimeloyl-ACP methyl ester carboxylesterase
LATFLLIHGSWHGAWCWERVLPRLRERGHEALAVDLPAHGDDPTPAYRATLGSYSRCVREAATALEGRPILVGHSMGGLAITQAAADDPSAFSALVYLCAFVPLPGEALAWLALRDRESLVRSGLQFRLSSLGIAPRRAGDLFYAGCSDADAAWATGRLRNDPARPLLQRLRQREQHSLPRAYIECSADRAISVGRQRAMAGRVALAMTASIDTDHSPFLSTPAELAQHLHSMASLAAGA